MRRIAGVAGALLLLIGCTLDLGADVHPGTGGGSATDVATSANSSTTVTSTASGGAGQGGAVPQGTVVGQGGQSAGQGGQGGAVSCQTPSECGTDDTCGTYACNNGFCEATYASKSTACSDDGGNVCFVGDCVPWAPLSTTNAPSARSLHTMLWTGTRAIVWGGRTAAGVQTDTGAMYDPDTDTWTTMSTTGAPVARSAHSAVWTGTEMIVWGGFGGGISRNDGGAYNPSTDMWRSLAASGITGRVDHVAQWSGTEMLIWGGRDGSTLRSDGARYNPGADSWGPIAAFPGGGRFNVMANWLPPYAGILDNGALVVFGGADFLSWFDDGYYWDPATNMWTLLSTSGASPAYPFEGASSVTLNGRVYMWGGFDGGSHYARGYWLRMYFNPTEHWYNLSPKPDSPTARSFHVAVPSTKRTAFFVWGGCGDSGCLETLGDGGYYLEPVASPATWTYVPEHANLAPRSDTAMINTGDVIIVWGGVDASNDVLASGARRFMPDP